METTITIDSEIRDKLAQLKYQWKCKDYNQVLLKLLEKVKGDE